MVQEGTWREIRPPLMAAAPAHEQAAGAEAPCRIVPGEGLQAFPGQTLAHRLADIVRRRGDSPLFIEQQPSDAHLLAGPEGPALPGKKEGHRYQPREAALNLAAGNRGGEKDPGLRLAAVQVRGDQEFLLPERPFYPGAPARDEHQARRR